jgi:multidrug efflux pump subunit AcrA (membrane-fusion protein)
MRRRVLLINGALVIALAVIGVVAYFWLRSPSRGAAAAEQTTTVTRGDVAATVSASGNAQSATNIGVSFTDCTGTLASISVKPGDLVKAGQVLASVNTADAQAAVDKAQDSLDAANTALSNAIAQAQTQLSNAEANEDLDLSQAQAAIDSAQAAYRAETDPQKKAQDKQSLTQAQNSYQSTKLRDDQSVAAAQKSLSDAQASTTQQAQSVATAQANLATAKAALADCTLTAPIAATVISVNGTVGSTPGSGSVASSSGSSGSGGSGSGGSGSGVSTSSGFITLSDLTKIVVPTSVSEAEIGAIKVGDPATITFAALTSAAGETASAGVTVTANGATVDGTVSAVDLTSTVSSSVVSYGVTVQLSTVPAGLRLGQSASVTITTASKSDVLRLSSSAITSVGNQKTVEVRDGQSVSVVTVTTGITGNGMTEIVSGVTEGETVIVPTTSSTSTSQLIRGGFGGGLGGGGGLLGGTR